MIKTLNRTFIPELGTLRRGKVRDIYEQNDRLVLVASDRVSVFDYILEEQIPNKGAILTGISNYWFEQTKDIIENHLIAHPDPSIVVAKKCQPLPIEVIVRGYITGSMWRDYAEGKREKSGVALPEGLEKNQKLEAAILTPSTKAEQGEHDEDISREEILKRGLVSEELWLEIERVALALYARGQELCAKNNLILVDTKYEFGLDQDGKLILIDEIHTPDSSRFWLAGDRGQEELKSPDKEYLRQWFLKQNYSGSGDLPRLPQEVIDEAARRYLDVYSQITGKDFSALEASPLERMLDNLKHSKMIRGGVAVILAGSESDAPFVQKIQAKLEELSVANQVIYGSAHKNTQQVMRTLDLFNQSDEAIVYITVAGRSNALSGVVAANTHWPVIACPPFKDYSDYAVNIHSTLQMPSKVPTLTVIDPANAALATERILRIANRK